MVLDFCARHKSHHPQSTLVALSGVNNTILRRKPRAIDVPVKTPNKCIRRKKPNRTRQKAIHHAGKEAVAEEEDAGDEPSNVQSSSVVPDAVDKHPECTASPNEEALPPPMVVL